MKMDRNTPSGLIPPENREMMRYSPNEPPVAIRVRQRVALRKPRFLSHSRIMILLDPWGQKFSRSMVPSP
jgi:hypothetical protein